MSFKKIIILDFSSAKVYVFPFDYNIYDNGEDMFYSEEWSEEFDNLGITFTNCQWMIVDDLEIKIY